MHNTKPDLPVSRSPKMPQPIGLQPRNLCWLLLSAVVIGLDQWTKYLATASLSYAQSEPVLPFLNWTLLHNYGAAFSMLADAGGWQRYFFTILAGTVSVVLMLWLMRVGSSAKTLSLGLALVLGGALGNLIDRINLGYVVDFVHVFYQTYHFPAFNVADAAITVGTILLIIDTFFLQDKREQRAP